VILATRFGLTLTVDNPFEAGTSILASNLPHALDELANCIFTLRPYQGWRGSRVQDSSLSCLDVNAEDRDHGRFSGRKLDVTGIEHASLFLA